MRRKRRPAGALIVVSVGLATLSASSFRAQAAPAPAVEPARVRAAASLVDRLIAAQLPIDLTLPRTAGPAPAPTGGSADAGAVQTVAVASLTDLRYCGPDKGGGRFRAAIRVGGTGAEAPRPFGLDGDKGCSEALPDLGKRLQEIAGDGNVVVADVEASWRAWELHFTLARVSNGGHPRPPAGLEARRELFSIATSGLRVDTDAGALAIHVVPGFAADAIELVAFVGEAGAPPPARSAAPPVSGAVAGMPADATVTADIPYSFANQLLRFFTTPTPLKVQLDREIIDVSSASIWGSAAGITVSASAMPRSVRESQRLTAQAAGDDLRVSAIRAEAQLESCAGQGMMASIGCNARNSARNAAASAMGATVTAHYQGAFLRELAGHQELRFEIASRRIGLDGDLLRIAAGTRGLLLGARLLPTEGGHSN